MAGTGGGNSRLDTVTLAFSNGSTDTWTFSDQNGWQEQSLGKVATSWVKMTIDSAYPSTTPGIGVAGFCLSPFPLFGL